VLETKIIYTNVKLMSAIRKKHIPDPGSRDQKGTKKFFKKLLNISCGTYNNAVKESIWIYPVQAVPPPSTIPVPVPTPYLYLPFTHVNTDL
jgi:hypothetical protein